MNYYKARAPLRACSEVCRYWAITSRKPMFATVVLTSATDMEAFGKLLKSYAPTILPSITLLTEMLVARLNTGKPWLHRIPSEILAEFGGRPVKFFVNSGELSTPEGPGTLTSLHPLVPHSLPNQFSPVTVLGLQKAPIRSGADLIRLLATLPRLQAIYLRDLRWKVHPSKDTFLSSALGLAVNTINMDLANEPGEDKPGHESFSVFWLLPALIARRRRPHIHTARSLRESEHLSSTDYEILLSMFGELEKPTALDAIAKGPFSREVWGVEGPTSASQTSSCCKFSYMHNFRVEM